MSQEDVDVVRQVLDAYSRRDVDALRTLNHPDLELDWSASPGSLAGIYRGFEEGLRFQVWRRSFDTLNAGDVDGAMSIWGPDPVFDLSPIGLGVYAGIGAIRGFWEDWTGTYQELSVEPSAGY